MAAAEIVYSELRIAECLQQVNATTDPHRTLLFRCMKKMAGDIKDLGRTFRIMDDDGNKSLDIEEFETGFNDYGIMLDGATIKELFEKFDTDSSGGLNFDEFLETIQMQQRGL